jgi:vacuolar-type H+-ATPase subunit F/Vma7
MAAPIFLGDELSAAGFRLGGARVRVPSAGEEASFLEWARRESDLVLITAAIATRVPRPVLAPALAAAAPLVLVVPDVLERVMPPDLETRLLGELGILE